ncbi:hypothetical protein ACTFIR_007633 [Dictyostelium discoideum]
MSSVSVHYSTHKINKVRFLNRNFHNDTSLFVTGTNHPVLSKNKISVWGLESRQNSDEVEELASVPIDGIVTELKVIEINNKPMIIGSTSKGSIFMYSIFNLPNKFEYVGYDGLLDKKYENYNNINNINDTYDTCNLLKERIWFNSSSSNNNVNSNNINNNNNNNNNGSCINSFDISYDQHSLVTVGNDGVMNLLSIENLIPIYTNRYIDGLSVNVVKSITSNQIITSGELGRYIKFWDIRSNSSQPVKTIKTQCPRIFSLAIHKDEQHIIAAGSSDGQVNLFDIRNDYSIDQNKTHNSNVWELSFSKSNPNQLYSCSEDGFIYQYSYNKDNLGGGMMTNQINNTFDIYSKEVSLLQLPTSIGSIDSFDINSNINRLICCSTSSQCLIVKSL